MFELNASPLGKTSSYIDKYNPDLLFPIPRIGKRNEINVPKNLPFNGVDIWNCFEISWLNTKGKPQVALAQVYIPCESPNIIESKSFKLYLNSFNNYRFGSLQIVENTMTKNLSAAAGSKVKVILENIKNFNGYAISQFHGTCLDDLDISCDTYTTKPEYLTVDSTEIVCEELYSDLLKSNCLVTGQPDWGSVKISYTGHKINHENLLKYLVSFRNHNEFHEQCVERIFMDITNFCHPKSLTVEARYTRRGGLDINPFRTTELNYKPANIRLCRQ